MPMLTTWRMPLAAVSRTLGVGEHGIEHASTSSLNGPCRGRAQRGVQHGAAFGAVDGRAGEHRVAALLEPAFARQVDEKLQRRRVDEVLREVGEDLRRLDRQRGEAARVAREGLAQVELAAVRLVVAGQRRPGLGLIAARRVITALRSCWSSLPRVDREGADAFGQLLGGHRVLVERPAEAGLVGHRRMGALAAAAGSSTRGTAAWPPAAAPAARG